MTLNRANVPCIEGDEAEYGSQREPVEEIGWWLENLENGNQLGVDVCRLETRAATVESPGRISVRFL